MRREETKCKKPLAGTQLPAIVQPNPFEPSQPQRQCPTAVGLGPGSWQHPFRYCLTNTSLTVHRPALALSNARCRSPTTCDSLTGQRVGVHTPNPLTSENRLQPATGTDLENVDCQPMATVPTYQSIGVRPEPLSVVAQLFAQLLMCLVPDHTPLKPAMPSLVRIPNRFRPSLRGSCAEGIQTRQQDAMFGTGLSRKRVGSCLTNGSEFGCPRVPLLSNLKKLSGSVAPSKRVPSSVTRLHPAGGRGSCR